MTQSRSSSLSKRRESGAGLIEVMVAVLLLAVGGLSVAMAQAAALRRAQGAVLSTTAVHASASLGDAMRANRSGVLSGAYNTAGELCATGAALLSGELAQNDLRRWAEALARGMDASANVCGSVRCNGSYCSVSVRWNDARASGEEGAPKTDFQLGVAL